MLFELTKCTKIVIIAVMNIGSLDYGYDRFLGHVVKLKFLYYNYSKEQCKSFVEYSPT